MEPQIRFCTSADGTRIAYATLGEGPPLVWVIGWGGSVELSWEHPEGRGFMEGLAVHAWLLITSVVALETALDMDRRPAIVTAVAGVLPMLALWALAWALT